MAGRQLAPDEVREKRIFEIRLMALAEVHLGQTGIDAKAYRDELETLIRRPLSVEWLEAQILVSVIAQVRPARTIGYLNKLRDKRIGAGETDTFDHFEALMRDYLHPLTLTNHGYGAKTFSDIDHGPVWQAVAAHCTSLHELGYEAFLNSGTLLGIIREGGLIGHDDDVDLAVVLKANTPEAAAAEWQTLTQTLIAHDLIEPNQQNDPAIVKLRFDGATEIDLFPAWQQDGRFFVYPYSNGDVPAEAVFPLQSCAVTGQPLPADPQEMLTQNYGPNWPKPDPLFKFPWQKAKAQFAPFLERLH